jgi:hypothetical protein
MNLIMNYHSLFFFFKKSRDENFFFIEWEITNAYDEIRTCELSYITLKYSIYHSTTTANYMKVSTY